MATRQVSIKFLQRIRNSSKRQLTLRLTQAVWNTPDCEHFTDVQIKNPLHTSHTDLRPHITIRLRTPEQIARGAGQTAHIYYDAASGDYEAFKLFTERLDSEKDEPGEVD
ncbi:unnamed protein product [Zymoseptoria tritici ST99CH_1A5]|uniref:Uncharacterized protein n=3 Tax=Zymoseptoria tritici TaxID=1047171 RepID=A0A1X7S646_ZYMT9|nr:unnamed protein product [Zymoseptoria tritici ST99CH_3D7]SMR60360.1 unnamed protein product [Zymoseptoria tritici ST99CH_1E4]SMR63473.1 unnamed protein product [Zymoseptoria tritici ST99CH_3D1]SMY28817.1 unnamed protein product [Zymoseptoria tritici ST99CH_1A5]